MGELVDKRPLAYNGQYKDLKIKPTCFCSKCCLSNSNLNILNDFEPHLKLQSSNKSRLVKKNQAIIE